MREGSTSTANQRRVFKGVKWLNDCYNDEMERIVLKIGTAVLNSSLDRAGGESASSPQQSIDQIVESSVPSLDDNFQQLIIVSSGAVGLGATILGLDPTSSKSLSETQMCASVGQTLLIECYSKALAKYGYATAQILLTSGDLQNQSKRANLISCLQQMQRHKIVPIVNENDVISTEELKPLPGNEVNWFGDNDKLSCLLAIEVSAQVLVILTTSKGIFKTKPLSDSETPIPIVTDLAEFDQVKVWEGSSQGRGGISSKIEAIKQAAQNGVPTWTTAGSDHGGLKHFFSNLPDKTLPSSGTFVLAGENKWKNS